MLGLTYKLQKLDPLKELRAQSYKTFLRGIKLACLSLAGLSTLIYFFVHDQYLTLEFST